MEKPAEIKATKVSGRFGEEGATPISNVSGCASKSAGTKTQTGIAPGECTKILSEEG